MVALTTVVERDKIRIVQFGDVYVIPEGGELGQVKWAWHPAIAFRRLKPCLSGAVCRSRRAHCNRQAPQVLRQMVDDFCRLDRCTHLAPGRTVGHVPDAAAGAMPFGSAEAARNIILGAPITRRGEHFGRHIKFDQLAKIHEGSKV